MPISTNFNVNPYYDDYDEDKKFLRLLYKPGYAVQARELTQAQTLLQKQVERFGNHIFKNGSIVTGGQVFLHTDNVRSGGAGESKPHENMPPFYVLTYIVIYIMDLAINKIYG